MAEPVRLYKVEEPAMNNLELFILNHWQFFVIVTAIIFSALVIALAFVLAGSNVTGTEANVYYNGLEKVI